LPVITGDSHTKSDLLLQACPIKSWHRRYTVRSSHHRRYRQYHWSHHPSASYHAPIVPCVIHLLFPSPSPSAPRRLPRSRLSSTPPPPSRLAICPSSPSPVNWPPMPATCPAALSSTQHLFWTTRRHCCRCLPRCPHFPWAHPQHFSIPKGEYDNSKRVIQLTTQNFCEQCNDPRSDSVPRTCILQYHIRFSDARSPTYNLRAVFNGAVGPSPSPRRLPRRPYTPTGAISRSSAYQEVSTICFKVLLGS